MKRAAFIDHSFKKISGSSKFFIDILQMNYQVEIYWDDSWKGIKSIDLKEIGSKNYDLVIFFQILYVDPRELRSNNIHNVVFVPMYDGAHYIRKDAWQKLSFYKFVSFSKTLHKQLRKYGLNSIYVQYFCPPAENVTFSYNQKLKGFFWQRYDRINWNHINALIKHDRFDQIHIHKAIDPPGYEFYPPNEYEMEKYNITISEWFEDPREYHDLLSRSDVFFVPRRHEGIGMSFIEAMSMGKCVVSPDTPTMNEYIRHGENGLLYSLEKLKPLSFDNIEEISRNAYETVKAGYGKWQEDKARILEFCEAPTPIWRRNGTAGGKSGVKQTVNDRIAAFGVYLNLNSPKIAKILYKVKKFF